MKNVLILGATGSIGVSTLDVLKINSEQYAVWGLTANTDHQALLAQIKAHKPKYAALSDADAAQILAENVAQLGLETRVLSGAQSLVELAADDEVDIVMAAIVGAAGLMPTITAAKAAKKVLLANKEALVCAGKLFMDTVKESGATLMPVDSEHNAIFQCLPGMPGEKESAHKQIRKVVLTGSGGPFRGWAADQLISVTPEQACAHPNWSMGRKISVDSATMMNKGLEFIEACWLFDLSPEEIEIVLHPQSVVHSMVEYTDGSVLAQMGCPDMRTPIAHALSWPERIESGVGSLDFSALTLNFETPDYEAYPCLKLAVECANSMGAAPIILNAVNEIAVQSFLDSQIGFLDIAVLCSESLQRLSFSEPSNLDDVIAIDAESRQMALSLLSQFSSQAVLA